MLVIVTITLTITLTILMMMMMMMMMISAHFTGHDDISSKFDSMTLKP